MLWINSQIAELNRINKNAAAVAGVKFIDMYDVFKGHELCSSSNAGNDWIHGVIPDPSKKDGSFHPTVAGQQAESAWILARM